MRNQILTPRLRQNLISSRTTRSSTELPTTLQPMNAPEDTRSASMLAVPTMNSGHVWSRKIFPHHPPTRIGQLRNLRWAMLSRKTRIVSNNGWHAPATPTLSSTTLRISPLAAHFTAESHHRARAIEPRSFSVGSVRASTTCSRRTRSAVNEVKEASASIG